MNYIESHFENMLSGKKVIIVSSASISIYRIPDLIRDLKREGATVVSAMSQSAVSMIGKTIMEWATGNPVVTEITGNIEHISMFDDNTILLVAPASYNTIGKMANGISDSIPSLFFSYALGHGNSIVVVPAMHKDMFANPVNKENIEKLKNKGVLIVEPEFDETKAKIADNDRIIDYACRSIYGDELKGKNVLIISGRSELPLDPVRILTNRSSGYTGYWLARNAFRLGASMITYIGNSEYSIPKYATYMEKYNLREIIIEINTYISVNKYDYIIMPMALMDFDTKESKSKLDSGEEQNIVLSPRPKVRDRIRQMVPGAIMVLFNLESEKTYDSKKFEKSDPDVVVLNSYAKNPFGETVNDYTIIEKDKKEEIPNIDKAGISLQIYRRIKNIKRDPGEPGMNSLIL
ncbi:bifunctional phosphopantothenoylcysteine decarboxylase/phosphopantothenate--cysteine ligase CoaBC [Ferroplasma sp.]|uniref:bifunctional phosphopantothenoylcysteine decarboxylase/phosphopantothenate--cysteine ligase CoaBC n=1 Tax=Ferroplasma sp. TaxID=2591003 RepID=UPI00307DEE23